MSLVAGSLILTSAGWELMSALNTAAAAFKPITLEGEEGAAIAPVSASNQAIVKIDLENGLSLSGLGATKVLVCTDRTKNTHVWKTLTDIVVTDVVVMRNQSDLNDIYATRITPAVDDKWTTQYAAVSAKSAPANAAVYAVVMTGTRMNAFLAQGGIVVAG